MDSPNAGRITIPRDRIYREYSRERAITVDVTGELAIVVVENEDARPKENWYWSVMALVWFYVQGTRQADDPPPNARTGDQVSNPFVITWLESLIEIPE